MPSSSKPSLPEQRFNEHLEALLRVIGKAERDKEFVAAYALLNPDVHGGRNFREVVLDALMDAYVDVTWNLDLEDIPLTPYRIALENRISMPCNDEEATESLDTRRAAHGNNVYNYLELEFVKIFGDTPRAELLDVLPIWQDAARAMVDMMESENTLRARGRMARMMERTENYFKKQFGKDQNGVLQKNKEPPRKGPYNKDELNTLWFDAQDADLPANVMKRIRKDLDKMDKLNDNASEYGSMLSPLETILDLPWHDYERQYFTLDQIRARLDEKHAGLDDVKDIILEQAAIEQRLGHASGKILCLNGAPGVGKSSLAQAVAYALDRPLVRVSLGGKRDVNDITGHRSTYVNAKRGRIIDAMVQAGVKNPIIQLDEIDKLNAGNNGMSDIESALLEVLDPEQNKDFTDSFIEIPFDLSEVTFIATSNDKWDIMNALRDRMEVVDVQAYSAEQKYEIARAHLLPKKMKACGIKETDFEMESGTLEYIIENYVREAGVRNLERQIEKICRKVAMQLQTGKPDAIPYINPRNIQDYLGKPKLRSNLLTHTDSVGVVNGLYVAGSSGGVMPFEVIKVPSKKGFDIVATGLMKETMRESIGIVKSWIKANTEKHKISPETLEKFELHVDAVNDGAKDGPSAGAAFVTACMSALLDKPVRADMAMTGKMTLGGRILAIGGTVEKLEGAMREGLKLALIPQGNLDDLSKATSDIKRRLHIEPVETIDDVLKFAFDIERKEAQVEHGKRVPALLSYTPAPPAPVPAPAAP